MSVGTKLLQAAAGNAGGDPVYVDDVFSCTVYEGNNTSRNIVNGIDLADKGGLVWTKNRDDSFDHNFVDSARGLTNSPYIRSNQTGSQGTDGQGITVFNSNGYTVGTSYSWNASNQSHVSWTFAKQEKFFDVLTYTGDGTDNRAIAHNLGSVPGMIIVKVTSHADNWIVYHRSLGYTKLLRLNTYNAVYTQDRWGDQNPTSTQFYVDNNQECNQSGETYVAYLFAHDEQDFGENSDEAIIKSGIYSGNSAGSATTNQTITLGFEPQWVMIKKSSGGIGRWSIFDNMRGVAFGGSDKHLSADISNAEQSDAGLRFDPDGFTLEGGNWNYTDGSTAHEYIYMAIARPHKPASEFSNTDAFKVQYLSAGEGSDTFISTGFPVDSVWYRKGTDSSPIIFGDRLRGGDKSGGDLKTSDTDADAGNSGAFFLDHSDGVTVDHSGGHFNASPSATDEQYARYFFRRMRGFFDVVTYEGNVTAGRQLAHNLGVVPELLIFKNRSNAGYDWRTYTGDSPSRYLNLNDNGAGVTSGANDLNGTAPTSSVVTVGSSGFVNGSSKNYIMYLFASATGISKVGTYTGTGSDLNVDCGFTAGAKLVIVKRTDGTGHWYLWDSGRGIVSGNDPYFLMNDQSAGQVSNTDYIDPLNAGFTITSSAPADLNASGGTYLFYAIA